MTDAASPRLLLVAFAAVLVAALAVVTVALTGALWAVAGALVVLLAGLAFVSRTMIAQLGDDEPH